MTLTELRYIVELADMRHFGRTAERCNVSQPTLSVAVRKLEEELGGVLFERTKTGVYPTPLGERVIDRARVLLRSAAGIKELADAGRSQLGSPFRLGAISTVAPYLLPQLIPHLQQQAPAMPLQVHEDITATLRHKLREGVVDAILVSLPFTDIDVVVQELYEEPLVVIMPQTSPLAALSEIDAAAIEGQSLLLIAEGHCLRDQVRALFPSLVSELPQINSLETINSNSLETINSLETMRGMVAAGLGLAIVPRSAAAQGVCIASRLVARPLVMPGASRTLALAWRASFPRHKAIDVVRKAIQVCSGAYWRFTTEPEPVEQAQLPVRHY